MYNVVFENDNGSKYYFGVNGTTAFDMDLGNGVPVNIGTSQGFSQVGETMQSRNISGRTISVKGAVYGNVQERKKSMRNVISPFSSGRMSTGRMPAPVFCRTVQGSLMPNSSARV